jgi:transcriptional regulator with XRE-family HTH domain
MELSTINMKEFGERLKKYREYKDLSQKVFGKNIGVEQTNVSHWEGGRNMPDALVAIAMIKAYPDLNIFWLFFNEGEMILTGATTSEVELQRAVKFAETWKQKYISEVEKNAK